MNRYNNRERVKHILLINKLKMSKQETIEKYTGKKIRDKKYNEEFIFDPQRDWFVLDSDPERFEIL